LSGKGDIMIKMLIIICLCAISTGVLSAQDIKSDPIYSIAISPQNPEIVYAGTKGAVYRIDKGECYRSTLLGEISEILLLAIDPTNAFRLFAVPMFRVDSVYRAVRPLIKPVLITNDGGNNWEKVNIPDVMKYTLLNHWVANYGSIGIDPLNPKLISIGAEGRATMLSDGPYDLACLIFSNDGGNKWNISVIPRIGTRYPRPIHSILSTSKTQFFSTPDGVFRFRNDVKKYDGCLKNSPKDVLGLIVDPSSRDRVLGITLDGKIYETVNNGDSFALLVETQKKISCLAIDPKVSKTLWIGTDNGIFKSNDNGTTWEETGKGQIEPKMIYSLAINPAYNQLMYCGTNQGMFVSVNQGLTWQKYKTPAEQRAEYLLAQAESLNLRKEDSKAILVYKQILDSFPSLEVAKTAEQKYREFEKRIAEQKINQIRTELQGVSEEKVKNAILKLGLTEDESNSLASVIDNLTSSDAIAVMKNGLALPLVDEECELQYRRLSRYQRFYAILCYKDFLGESAVKELSSMLNISNTTAENLVNINPKSFFVK